MMNNAFKESQLLFWRLQEDFKKLDEIVYRHEVIIPKLREEVGTSLCKVNSILAEVDKKMDKFQEWVHYVNSLNEITLNRSPATTMESVRQQRVEQLEGAVQADC